MMNRTQGYASVRPANPSAQHGLGLAPGALVQVLESGTITPVDIFEDDAGVTPLANPFAADADGYYEFYVQAAKIDVQLSGGGIITPYTLGDVGPALPQTPSYTTADLPAPSLLNAGAIVRVTDGLAGYWGDTGTQYRQLGGQRVINILDHPYNAVGDGVTDDAPAIQAAIDAVEATGLPGTIYCPTPSVGYALATGLTLSAHGICLIADPATEFLYSGSGTAIQSTAIANVYPSSMQWVNLTVRLLSSQPGAIAFEWRGSHGRFTDCAAVVTANNQKALRVHGDPTFGTGSYYNIFSGWAFQGDATKTGTMGIELVEGTSSPNANTFIGGRCGQFVTNYVITGIKNVFYGSASEGAVTTHYKFDHATSAAGCVTNSVYDTFIEGANTSTAFLVNANAIETLIVNPYITGVGTVLTDNSTSATTVFQLPGTTWKMPATGWHMVTVGNQPGLGIGAAPLTNWLVNMVANNTAGLGLRLATTALAGQPGNATFLLNTQSMVSGTAASYAMQVSVDGNATAILFRNSGAVEINQSGLTIGAATGGNKGLGSINVSADIYKNNTAYTNPAWVFEHFYSGHIQRYRENFGAAEYTGLPSIDETRQITRDHHELPQMRRFPDGGLHDRGDMLLASLEQAFLYIFQLHDRLAALEGAADRS